MYGNLYEIKIFIFQIFFIRLLCQSEKIKNYEFRSSGNILHLLSGDWNAYSGFGNNDSEADRQK